MDDQNNPTNPPANPTLTPPVTDPGATPQAALDTTYIPGGTDTPQPTFNPPADPIAPSFPSPNTISSSPEPAPDYSAVFPQPATTPAPITPAIDTPAVPWPSSTTVAEPTPETTPPVPTPAAPSEPVFSQPEETEASTPPSSFDPVTAPTPIPTFTPPPAAATSDPSFGGIPSFGDASSPQTQGIPNFTGQQASVPASTPEPGPTDLSQLSETDNQPPPPEVYTPPVSTNENLVIPTAPSGIPESLDTGAQKKSMMPLLIAIGGVILLIVTGASLYFILGMGKNGTAETTSLPIQQAPLTTPPKAIVPPPQPAATESGSFGSLNGTTATESSKPTSAFEAARQRAAQSSPSPSPAK